MDKLNVQLEHCYGIGKLQTQFDFSKERVYSIYAPNGAMKSSLAQTFQDIADAVPSVDRIFHSRATIRAITDENGVDLAKESVLVVKPYDQEFGHTEKTSTLLVDAALRKEYEQLHVDINKAKDLLLAALKTQSGSKKDIAKEISSAFMRTDAEFEKALVRIKTEVETQEDAPFADVPYDTIFDEAVLKALGGKDVQGTIEGYVRRYNELLAASNYFKRGIFDHYNAAQIAKNPLSERLFAIWAAW